MKLRDALRKFYQKYDFVRIVFSEESCEELSMYDCILIYGSGEKGKLKIRAINANFYEDWCQGSVIEFILI